MEPVFFTTPAEFRAWMEEHHAAAGELLVGFHKKGSGTPGITWPESVDVALCFGWIDGVRRGIDAARYSIRFTPRRPRSIWSTINVRRYGELLAEGLVAPAGERAFAARREDRTSVYSYERGEPASLGDEREASFRANEAAWAFFSAQAPWYRRTATHWVVSAKKPETRARRLAQLIEDSAAGRRLRQLDR